MKTITLTLRLTDPEHHGTQPELHLLANITSNALTPRQRENIRTVMAAALTELYLDTKDAQLTSFREAAPGHTRHSRQPDA